MKTALALLLVIMTSSYSFADGLQLLGTDTRALIANMANQGVGAMFNEAQGSVEKDAPEHVVIDGDTARKATADELVGYLQKIERLNPGKSWQQIMTRLHHHAYPYDGNTAMYGIPLFAEGPDNENWQDVQLPTDEQLPRYIIDENGELINFKHALAGLRASMNRDRVDRALWMRINTYYGDQYQVWNERMRLMDGNSCALVPERARSWVSQCRNYNAMSQDEFRQKFDNANRWYPEEQRRGNDLAFTLERLLRTNNASTLSEAVEMTNLD